MLAVLFFRCFCSFDNFQNKKLGGGTKVLKKKKKSRRCPHLVGMEVIKDCHSCPNDNKPQTHKIESHENQWRAEGARKES